MYVVTTGELALLTRTANIQEELNKLSCKVGDAMWRLLATLLTVGSATLLAPSCLAQTARNCDLPTHLYDQRRTAEPLSEAQRTIDRKYAEFMKAVAQSYAHHDAAGVRTCCDAVKDDIVGFQFCALVRYLLSDRKEPDLFLAAMPETEDQRQALWFIEQISAGGTTETPTSLPGIALPDGLLFKFVNEIFDLMKKGNATAAEKYCFLYEDENGEFGEYMDDQLPKLFLGYPQQVLTLWPVLKKHRKRLEMLQGFTTDGEKKRIAAKYEGLCQPDDTRCSEVRRLFVQR